MKVCYVDESGQKGDNPVVVMVGILADAARLHRTEAEFNAIFGRIQGLFGEPLKELKGSKILNGIARWRNVDPDLRKALVRDLCGWVAERKHGLVLAAVDKAKLQLADDLGSPHKDIWLSAAMHVALQVQKCNQGKSNNKGKTFLFFDENKMGADALAELLWSPPSWTDDYYGRKKHQERLDQVVDSAFAVKSHHAGLVQIADLFAYLFRRYAELAEYGATEVWPGEQQLIAGYVDELSPRLLPRATRWPAKGVTKACAWFNAVAPDSLKTL